MLSTGMVYSRVGGWASSGLCVVIPSIREDMIPFREVGLVTRRKYEMVASFA